MQNQPPNDEYSYIKNRIEEIGNLIYEVASGNFDYKLELSDKEDELEGLIGGINMLGEELKATTVSRDFMESIYKGVADILLILNTDLTIDRVNDKVKSYLKYDPDDLIGINILDLVDHDQKDSYAQLLNDLDSKDTFQITELRLKMKNGAYLETSASFSNLYNNQKEHLGKIIIAKDITLIKEKEHELKEAKIKAEKANNAKSDFLANMSHEIRTPLNGVLGFVELLSSTPLDADQQEYLGYVRDSGQRLASLLNDILDLSKVESGKLAFEHISFNISDTIKSCFLSHSLIARQKGLKLEIDMKDGIPDYVYGDPSRLSQIISNLVGNAIKFTEAGSVKLNVSAKQIDEGHVKMTLDVLDTGIGIPSEFQETIFQSFTQADYSITRKYGGSGLGLSIINHLVKMMNGSVHVESPPKSYDQNTGSLFKIQIPMEVSNAPYEQISEQNETSALQFRKNINVLLVDDNEINLMLAKKQLENLNAYVTTAADGAQALEQTKENTFDIILMDLQMPEMDGFEATRALRKKGYPGPIIALSANVYDEDISSCYSVGMNGHIAKPFTRDQIYLKVKAVLHI